MAKSPSAEILDEQEAKQLEEATDNNPHEDDEEVFERPGWLPDGWIMEVYHADDGTILQYYTSPVSRYTFMRESDVMQYLFAGIEERFLESEDCVADNNLSRTHQWLPKGWLIEIRAGGENMDKMYKLKFSVSNSNSRVLFPLPSRLPKLSSNDCRKAIIQSNGKATSQNNTVHIKKIFSRLKGDLRLSPRVAWV
ncbi:hypothetical protein GUJ93_ZPchr0004g38548 [Zizania palustris]|uniref:MBD domain-containing protein n=1 Tax=Zizania palustris TaxID=103762 RepID=A0A8J5SDC9_ZIZPA|nr:hypothetical protein GUJ93_ZPchr0004g38548 [Zizania palustris]